MSITKEKRFKSKESYKNYHEIFKIVSDNKHLSYLEIAEILNKCGFKTKRNLSWNEGTIRIFFSDELKIKTKRYYINLNNKSEIERIIFENQDKSQSEIAEILNKCGFKTIRGLDWTKNTVNHYEVRNLKLTPRYGYSQIPIIDLNQTDNIKQNEENDILPNYEIKDLVFEQDGKFCTDSLMIASTFDVEHSYILKIIRSLDCSQQFREGNFSLSSYKSKQNKELPMYILTRDGFSMIAMGLTGSKSIQFKEIYINQFNKMESFIKSKSEPTPITPVQNNQMDLLRQMFLGIDETNKIVLETKEQSNRAEKMAEFAINKIIDMETENKKAKEELEKEVEYSNRLLPDLKIRYKCQNIINNYVATKFLNASKEDFKSIWNLVDKEFYDRFRINLGIRKNNEAKQTGKKVSRYDIAEELNRIQELYDVISFLFKIEKVG